MIKQYLSIDDIREAHEAMVHLVELGAAYAYRSGDPYDPIFLSASRIAGDQCGKEVSPAELRREFQRYQRWLIARCN